MTKENNYKQKISTKEMRKRGTEFGFSDLNRAQISVYIIIALVIVVLAVIVYFLYPRLSTVIGGDADPNTYMRDCIEPEMNGAIETLSKQGGYADPEGYVMFEGNRVKYLCYTSQYYVPCYVQQPLLREHFEQELSALIKNRASECIGELKKYYQQRGYEVSGGDSVGVDVSVLLNSINVVVEAPMTFTKETSQKYQTFRFGKNSKMYSLLMTATSIIDFESTYGDSETTIYMKYYPQLQLRKIKLLDGSTVYTVKDVNTDESFNFASRSLAWPGGLGLTA